jgi:hypothetical protein
MINLLLKMVNTTIYTKFTGQLGNHLFQFAAAYGLSKKYNMDLVICYNDHNHFEKMYINTIFKNYKCIPVNQINPYNTLVYSEKTDGVNSFMYNPNIINPEFNYFLDGYFQNEKYFKNYKNEIRKIIISQDIINKILTRFPKIMDHYFFHVRRCDYVGFKAFEIDYDAYFKLAIDHILLKDPTAHFYVVSDDIPFCKEYHLFQNSHFTITENLDTIDTLHFMSLCFKGGVCCNSSFSWWGSYLNINPNKIVTMPRQWMTNSDTFDVWPEGTVIIEYPSNQNLIDKI